MDKKLKVITDKIKIDELVKDISFYIEMVKGFGEKLLTAIQEYKHIINHEL